MAIQLTVDTVKLKKNSPYDSQIDAGAGGFPKGVPGFKVGSVVWLESAVWGLVGLCVPPQ